MTGRVVVVGSANIDQVLGVDHIPVPGQTVLARRSERGFGGKGANQAVAAAVAGAAVMLLGRVGADADGAAYRARLESFGIDCSRLLETAGTVTGVAYVMVDGAGENSIVVDQGANSAVQVADLDPLTGLGSQDVLLVQCELPALVIGEAIGQAARAGARVVLNLAPFVPLPAEVIALATTVVVNEEEATQLAAHLAALSVEHSADDESNPPTDRLLVTRGAAGATWGAVSRPALAVPSAEVVDTTGAGDAFCGALAAALAAGLGREAALDQALAAGADAVRRVGAQPAVSPIRTAR